MCVSGVDSYLVRVGALYNNIFLCRNYHVGAAGKLGSFCVVGQLTSSGLTCWVSKCVSVAFNILFFKGMNVPPSSTVVDI